ncbi:MAG: DUF421 domain-containing protein [Clostridia bacterium]|nr:DUF421 domain-containing protein [Clostridia bacterium]
MTTILIRTLIVYLVLIATMRLMGKRQIGELEVTDLVTTLLISEIASLPITNQEIPVSYAVIPMITLLFLEVLSSVVLIRFPSLKKLVSASPTVIIRNGELNQRALRELRISMDELMSEIRQQGLTSLEQVDCAILEKNGKLTVLPKAKYATPTAEQLGIEVKDEPLMHIVYCNGSFSKQGLQLIEKDRMWLEAKLKKQKLDIRELFCVMADETGNIIPLKKAEEKTVRKEKIESS